ncbi:PQQ-dependent sugar dehydrogenase [Arcticibacterium luteifluviistationis]|uniref:Glucose sorbosone dehydrogenase n=1 Tax=Arcticibacterium luteifluviistationis TaxID=1784714 RepID=A0A2Z4GEX2_9BACT|nr:PQQ-dependent sugar dehydrogenase [Arcticibacterium luteifluviistationis]AWV99701.1 glucose sorbosone dehydrogenase [Arcticibacterium luteifluviistationis]
MKTLFLLISSVFYFAPSCSDSTQKNIDLDSNEELKMVVAFDNLEFTRPVDFQSPKDGTNRIFVVEQEGIISVFENKPEVKEKSIFLDISDQVDDESNEEGLLGLAFHPKFKENGFFYLNYTVSSSETYISRFTVDSSNPSKANPNSELILLKYDQPYGNHNGGQVIFGPDGFLYISVGDGGSGGDPKGNGQNAGTLLGSILRIDVDKPENGKNYGIPQDNPFVNSTSKRKEIFAYGLRNPWRISFDTETGRLWCADVGQNAYEEVDIIIKGGNYGWNEMEGLHTYKSGSNSPDYIAPVLEIAQSTGDKSITGGFAYRGTLLPTLVGKYIFADYVSGRIYALSENADGTFTNEILMDQYQNISAFGIDQDNELYICAFDGKIYTLEQ